MKQDKEPDPAKLTALSKITSRSVVDPKLFFFGSGSISGSGINLNFGYTLFMKNT
jgi:hypothetical protein